MLLGVQSLPNAGLFNWANNRSDRLAAAGSPGTVRVVDSRREIRLCRKISGNATPSNSTPLSVFSPPSLQLELCVSSSGAPALHRHLHWAKPAGDDPPRCSQASPRAEPAAERSEDGVRPSGGWGEESTSRTQSSLLNVKSICFILNKESKSKQKKKQPWSSRSKRGLEEVQTSPVLPLG